MKPLPEETHLTPGDDLDMSVTISGSISNEDDVTISLGHSFRGVYHDITKHLDYKLSEDDMEEEEGSRWKINMTLPYPHSQASGVLTLSVGDGHSGDVTTTRLVIVQKGKGMAPFFDPVPKSVKTYSGQDVLIDTRVKGSSPLEVICNYCST